MLYAGQADLHCLGPGGQNGGSLLGTLYLVPDDGELHWNSLTRELGPSNGIPWVVMCCVIENYLSTWYGVAGPLGSLLRYNGWPRSSEFEVARIPVHMVASKLDLSTKIFGPRWSRNSGSGDHDNVVGKEVIDRLDFGVDLPKETVAAVLVGSDHILELEYATALLTIQPIPPSERQTLAMEAMEDAIAETLAEQFEPGTVETY